MPVYTSTGTNPIKDRSKDYNKPNNVVISGDDIDDRVRSYECDRCHYVIHTRKKTGILDCTNCPNYIDLDDVPVKSRIEMPKPRDSEAFVATVHYDPNAGVSHTKHNQPAKLKDGMAALSRQRGTLKVTSYYDSSEGVKGAD